MQYAHCLLEQVDASAVPIEAFIAVVAILATVVTALIWVVKNKAGKPETEIDVVNPRIRALEARMKKAEDNYDKVSDKMELAAQSVFAVSNRTTFIEAKLDIDPPRYGS